MKRKISRLLLNIILLSAIVLAEWLIYHYIYVQDVVSVSKTGIVKEVNTYQKEELVTMSGKEYIQNMIINHRNPLLGIGIRIYYTERTSDSTIIRIRIIDNKKNECIAEEKLTVNTLNSGDFYQVFFNREVEDILDAKIEITCNGENNKVRLLTVDNDLCKEKLVIDGEEVENYLYLITNESKGFVKKTSNIYCILIVLLTVIVYTGLYFNEGNQKNYEER